MRLSRYPRIGQGLAPSLLSSVLDLPVPPRLISGETNQAWKFSELDEESWERFSGATCQKLGEAIVDHIVRALPNLEEGIREQHVPKLPPGTHLGDLHLDTRTRNCLRKLQRQGRIGDAEDLASFTLNDLLAIDGFGAKCLVDLLTSVEARLRQPIEVRPVQPKTANPQAFAKVTVPPAYPDISREEFELVLGNLRLPKFPQMLSLGDLALSDVTQRWLRHQGFDKNLPKLRGMTIGRLFAVPGFQLPYLVELVRALDEYCSYTFAKDRDADEAESPPEEAGAPGPPSTLEAELVLLASCHHKGRYAANSKRNQRIAMRYFGFDGLGGATLGEIGKAFGLTRERIRQICHRIPKVYQRCKPPTPLLTKCINFIASQAPCEAEEVEEKLRSEGLTAGKFRVEGIIRAGELFGLEVPFVLDEPNHRRVIVRRDNAPRESH